MSCSRLFHVNTAPHPLSSLQFRHCADVHHLLTPNTRFHGGPRSPARELLQQLLPLAFIRDSLILPLTRKTAGLAEKSVGSIGKALSFCAIWYDHNPRRSSCWHVEKGLFWKTLGSLASCPIGVVCHRDTKCRCRLEQRHIYWIRCQRPQR